MTTTVSRHTQTSTATDHEGEDQQKGHPHAAGGGQQGRYGEEGGGFFHRYSDRGTGFSLSQGRYTWVRPRDWSRGATSVNPRRK